jgi:hypothetical protein
MDYRFFSSISASEQAQIHTLRVKAIASGIAQTAKRKNFPAILASNKWL